MLAGKTFTNSSTVGATGTMPNHGDLNWKPASSTTQTVQPGYYSGGTLDSSAAYSKGMDDADARVNTNSESYKEGQKKGFPEIIFHVRVVNEQYIQNVSYTIPVPNGYNKLKLTSINAKGGVKSTQLGDLMEDTPYDIATYSEINIIGKGEKQQGDYCIVDFYIHLYRE